MGWHSDYITPIIPYDPKTVSSEFTVTALSTQIRLQHAFMIIIYHKLIFLIIIYNIFAIFSD